MAENTLALLKYLASPESPLPTLTAGYSKPTTVFFYAFHYFFIYSFNTAKMLYTALLVASVVLVKVTFVNPAPALRKSGGIVSSNLKGFIAHLLGLAGAVVGANTVAFIMTGVLDKGMSWFSIELSCLLLYGPAAITGKLIFEDDAVKADMAFSSGALLSQIFVGRVHEQSMFTSLLLLQTSAACVIQFLGV